VKYHKETAPCGKCGKPIRFPADGLNMAKISKGLGSTMYHDACLPTRGKMMLRMARNGAGR
jgi:hypothetical protein